MDSVAEIVAFVCGRCGRTRSAHFTPHACFGGCGANFAKGEPLALVHVELDVVTSEGAVEIAPAMRVAFLGAWTPEERAQVEGAFRGA